MKTMTCQQLGLAFCLTAEENGNATAENGTTYSTSLDRKTTTTDIRPRLQISTGYKNYGFTLDIHLDKAIIKRAMLEAQMKPMQSFCDLDLLIF